MIVQKAKKFTHDMTTDDCHDDNHDVGGSEDYAQGVTLCLI